MELLGFEVEAQTPTEEDRATEVGRWLVDLFGVVPRLTAYVDEAATARVTGPGGLTIDLVQPEPPELAERQITDFITSAADLAGPPTDELADEVLAIVAAAYDEIDRRLDGVAHNKVLATHLLLSQRSRQDPPDDPRFWQRSAASTLLSSFVGRGASENR